MRVLVALLLVLAAGCSSAEEDTPYIAVTETGWTEAVPDMLDLTLSIRATGKDVSAIQAQVDLTAQQVVSAARELGVQEGDIDSSRISVQPEYRWQNQERSYLGQVVQRDIAITLRDVERYGELVQALVRFDLHQMSPPRPGHSNLDALRLAAIDHALERARTKAGHIAQGADVGLGPVIRVEEAGATGPAPMPRVMAAESSAASAPNIHFGKRRISASVYIRFAIQ